jgi:hypothetical protein
MKSLAQKFTLFKLNKSELNCTNRALHSSAPACFNVFFHLGLITIDYEMVYSFGFCLGLFSVLNYVSKSFALALLLLTCFDFDFDFELKW